MEVCAEPCSQEQYFLSCAPPCAWACAPALIRLVRPDFIQLVRPLVRYPVFNSLSCFLVTLCALLCARLFPNEWGHKGRNMQSKLAPGRNYLHKGGHKALSNANFHIYIYIYIAASEPADTLWCPLWCPLTQHFFLKIKNKQAHS